MKRSLPVVIMMILALLGLILFSCSGSSITGSSPALTGKMTLYVTDDLSLFSQVTVTVNRVELRNTGLGSSCDLMTSPLSLNVANLPSLLQFVNETACPPGPYNRVHIEFDRSVQVMSGPTDNLNNCSFDSFKNENGNQPNMLLCDQAGICSLDLNGAVNVRSLQDQKMALDFDLKNFDIVNLGTPACAVTMKVSPLTPEQMRRPGRQEVITGLVSRLSITDRSFDLVRGSRTFSVLYSAVSTTEQLAIDALLLRAQADRLRTKVFTAGIDLTNSRIEAAEIIAKVEGTVSDLAPGPIFTVHYGAAGTIPVDASRTLVQGVITDGAWVDVKLFGLNELDGLFLADTVEVERPGTMTED